MDLFLYCYFTDLSKSQTPSFYHYIPFCSLPSCVLWKENVLIYALTEKQVQHKGLIYTLIKVKTPLTVSRLPWKPKHFHFYATCSILSVEYFLMELQNGILILIPIATVVSPFSFSEIYAKESIANTSRPYHTRNFIVPTKILYEDTHNCARLKVVQLPER